MDRDTTRRLEYDKVRRRLADMTSFSAGRRLALDLEPSADEDEVRRRLALTTAARAYSDRHGSPPLEGAHDMRSEVEGAQRGRVLLPAELLDIRATIGAARRMRRALCSAGSRDAWPDLAALADGLEPCPALGDAIDAALDDDGAVRDGASPALRRIRGELRVAHDRLSRMLDGMINNPSIRENLQEALITQRNGRQVLPVKQEHRARVPGVVHDTSDSGATVFVEPLAAVELGNRCRELEADEQKEVLRVLRSLSEHVADEGEALGESVRSLAALDLAFACGDLGHAMRASEPSIVDAPTRFRLLSARHPLLDPEGVVPVDVDAGEGHRVLLITGPNTGGKTVTLKTTGLLLLMAQSGLHIPASSGSYLSVFDGVYADIGDEQSIEQSLSTFSSHMTTTIAILGAATNRSLVLLDELGAGTDPAEGVALAGALLEHLRALGAITIASTHFSELKLYAHSTPGVVNACVEFDPESLQPTYVLTIGLPGKSNALAIAERLGLPAPILARARDGVAHSETVMEDLLAEIREARTRAAADRDAAAAARRQADQWADRLEAAVADVDAQRDTLVREARSQADAELEAVRDALHKLLREARRESSSVDLREAAAEREEAVAAALRQAEAVAEALAEVAPTPLPRAVEAGLLRPGAWVHVAGLNQQGEVLRLGDRDAEVQLGRLRITVPLADLTVTERPAAEALDAGGTPPARRNAPVPSVPLELDLRGMRVDEGLEALDSYLDRAVLSGMPYVRVIHGHGTGAMRAAVRDAMRHFPGVTRFRPGERGEGGDGVTVAYFD